MTNRLVKDVKGQLGWQGLAGIVLLLFAGAFLELALNPLEQEADVMRARLHAAKTGDDADNQGLTANDRQQELARFCESLPQEKDVTDTLAVIYDVAGKAGLSVRQAEYHLDSSNPSEITYVMNFPMRGQYPQVRVFLAKVLADNPALALDRVSFRREHIGDAAFNVDIRFTLFLRPVQ